MNKPLVQVFAWLLGSWLLGSAAYSAVSDGYVVKVDSRTVLVDWGKNSGIQKGDTFSIFRKGETIKHPVTGEVLGETPKTLASGVIEQIEDKYSVAQLVGPAQNVVPGDRTRFKESSAAPEAVAAPVPSTSSVQSLKLVYQGKPISDTAKGISIADIDGDGTKDVVIAFEKYVEVFNFKNGELVSKAKFKERSVRNWLMLSTGDLARQGRSDIFLSSFDPSTYRPWTFVVTWENGALKRKERFAGFVQNISYGDSQKLVWQDLLRFQGLRYSAPYELVYDNGRYKPSNALKIPISDDQLFGFAEGDWDGDQESDTVWFEKLERLRVAFKDAKWKDSDISGGSRNSFTLEKDAVGYWSSRLVSWQPEQEGSRRQLIVPTNIPELGVRMTYLKFYKHSRLTGAEWNGLTFARRWEISFDGYLADYAVGDGANTRDAQVWIAVIGPGDKTILSAYDLP